MAKKTARRATRRNLSRSELQALIAAKLTRNS